MCVPKTSDHIQINIRMPNPCQEPPTSSKAPNEDLKDMDVLCTIKIMIESQKLDHGCIKTSDHIQIKIKIPNPSQEPQASSKDPNEDVRGHGCSLHLQNQDREQKFRSWVYKRPMTISKSRSRC